MKKLFFLSISILTIASAFAQAANVTWGDEFKLKKGSTDLSVIHADNSGLYVKESHLALKAYFVIGATSRESSTLIKLDKNLAEEYRNDFNKELKGKEFETYFFLQNKLFILATDYSRKDRTLTLFAGEIDQKSGELTGDWKEVTSWQKEEKNDGIDFKATYNSDSTEMVLVSSLAGKEKNNYEVRQFDKNLQLVGKAVKITNEFEPKLFQLEDVIYASNGNVVMVARIYDYQEGKKHKTKFLEFQNYNIRIYDADGKQVKEINTMINAKWLVSTKVLQLRREELVLAAFYSDEKKGSEINGMLVQRIDSRTGEVRSTSMKDINTSMISTLEDDNDNDGDDESRKERKAREKLEKIQSEEEGFSKYMQFRSFVVTPDNGLVIIAERFRHYVTSTTEYHSSSVGGSSYSTTTYYDVYESGNIMTGKVELSGNISWLHVIPKEQRETIQINSNGGPGSMPGFGVGMTFFNYDFNRPFFSGLGILSNNSAITIVFNDHKKNDKVLQLGQKVRRISYFGKSDCFGIKLDPITGKYTRSVLFSNNDVPTSMPRLGSNLGNDLYIIGREDRLLGRTKIAVAKISLK